MLQKHDDCILDGSLFNALGLYELVNRMQNSLVHNPKRISVSAEGSLTLVMLLIFLLFLNSLSIHTQCKCLLTMQEITSKMYPLGT